MPTDKCSLHPSPRKLCNRQRPLQKTINQKAELEDPVLNCCINHTILAPKSRGSLHNREKDSKGQRNRELAVRLCLLDMSETQEVSPTWLSEQGWHQWMC